MPRSCSFSAVTRPTPHRRSTGSGCRKSSSRAGWHDEQPVGLAHGAGHLGQELRAGHADGDGQTDPVAHRGTQPGGDVDRFTGDAPQAADVEERFVDGDALDEGGGVLEDLEDRLARVDVRLEARLDDDGVGAQGACLAATHRRAHATALGLVARREDHATADDHRPAAQRRLVALLDRRVERIEIGMQDRRRLPFAAADSHEQMFADRAGADNRSASRR